MAGQTQFVGAFTRYRDSAGFATARDPFDDLALHVGFLASTDYTSDLLRRAHGLEDSDAARRAPVIGAHVRLALRYLEQSQESNVDVSFVPCYYAILNLIKVCILFSDLHVELPTNRSHGASYISTGEPSRSLLQDKVVFGKTGTIPLFYRLLTGRSIRDKTVVSAHEWYPFMQDVGMEWKLARGNSALVHLVHSYHTDDVGAWITWSPRGPAVSGEVKQESLPVLINCTRRPEETGYISFRGLPYEGPESYWDQARGSLAAVYLYYPLANTTTSAVMNPAMPFPEEFPIVLAFLHMSSVVRYDPEHLEALKDSRFWPCIGALRAHSLLKFLLLFLSWVRKAHVTIVRE